MLLDALNLTVHLQNHWDLLWTQSHDLQIMKMLPLSFQTFSNILYFLVFVYSPQLILGNFKIYSGWNEITKARWWEEKEKEPKTKLWGRLIFSESNSESGMIKT